MTRKSGSQLLLLVLLVGLLGLWFVHPPRRLQVFAFVQDGDGGATLVGESWGEGTLYFSDGSSAPFNMPSIPVTMMLLQSASYTRTPKTFDFNVKSVVVPDYSKTKPYFTDLVGAKHYADDLIVEITSGLVIEVNNVERYRSPSQVSEYYCQGLDTADWLNQILGIHKTYRPGENSMPVSVEGWAVDQYLSSTQDTAVAIKCSQKWKMYGIWYATSGRMFGKPVSDPPYVQPYEPVWSTVIKGQAIIIRTEALLEPELEFTLICTATKLPQEQLKKLFEVGQYSGIGAMHSLGYGQYQLLEMKLLE